MTKRRAMAIFFTLACVVWLGVRWSNSRARPSHILGVDGGRLADCPRRPNCVSTQASDAEQQMPPIPAQRSTRDAMARLEAVVNSMPGARVISTSDDYLHAEFRSFLFAFVDDVELWLDQTDAQIHFRSASRVGYSDFGVNRRRMAEIRRRYEAPD